MRSNTLAVDAVLRQVLPAHWVPDLVAPPNYSAWIELPQPGPKPPGPTRFNVLYRSSRTAVRARSPRRVVEGLVSYLSGHAARDDDLVVTNAAAVVGRDAAILVPGYLLAFFEEFQQRLARQGWRVVDSVRTTIDPAAGELLVLEPALDVEESAMRALGAPSPRESPGVAPGRYPIAQWYFLQDAGGASMSRAAGVAAALGTVAQERLGPAPTLQALAKIFRSARPLPIAISDPKAAAETVLSEAAAAGIVGWP